MRGKFLFMMLPMLAWACLGMAQVTVFDNANSGTPYRIPAILKAKNGDLVALSDYRPGKADIGLGESDKRIDIYGKISSDNGATWGKSFTAATGSGTSGFANAHGDAAVVCDRGNGRMLMMCASGSIGYPNSKVSYSYSNRVWNMGWSYKWTRGDLNNVIRVGRSYSDDNGQTWSDPVDVTANIYGIWDGEEVYTNSQRTEPTAVTGLFFSSGRICQSRKIKVGNYYRLYAALCTNLGSLVVYSDDFGETWNALGGTSARPAPNGNEAKVEELPNGNVLLSCRNSNDIGRYFNIFTYTDQDNAKGSWGTVVLSGSSNTPGETYAASCNGEIMLVPTNDGKYVLLQSAAMSSGRENVGIYWKVLASESDYDDPSDFQTGWNSYKVSSTTSCYSTMTLDANDNVAFIYEENSANNGYDIQFRTLMLDEITKEENSDPWVGKVVTVAGLMYDTNGENITGRRYMCNKDLTLGTEEIKDLSKSEPTYNYYWVVSKDPGTSTYYLSSLNGDGYMGKGIGISYVDGLEYNNIPICTDDYTKEFDFLGFVKSFQVSSYESRPAVEMTGHALKFVHDGNDARVVAIAYDNGELNWYDHSAKYETSDKTPGRYWGTDFEIKEVKYIESTEGIYCGTFEDPQYNGFPVKLVRSDDGKIKYDVEDYNYYATLKLPFAVTLPDNVTAYSCGDLKSVAEGTVVPLQEMSLTGNVLPRETPVLLRMTRSDGDSDKQKTIYLRPALAQSIQPTGFKGTLGKKTFTAGEYDPETNHNFYILGKKNGHVAFYWLNNNEIGNNKAYYVYNGAAYASSLMFDFGGTTAIDQVSMPDAADDNAPVYDLMGRKVSEGTSLEGLAKGIYVVNGKKVVLK